MLLEFGVEGLKAGRELGGLKARSNALAEFVIANPSVQTADGKPITEAIVQRAAEVGGVEHQQALSSILEHEGYTVAEGRIISVAAASESQPPYARTKRPTNNESAQRSGASQGPNITSPRMEVAATGLAIFPTVFTLPSVSAEPNLVSVMMPFEASFNPVYEAIKAACRAASFDCKRVDDLWENTVVMQEVFSLIYRSRIVVVDFSTRNPNVFYETGIAHTLGKPVVPITQQEGDVPFDLRHHRHLRYLCNSEGLQNLTEKLASRLRTLRGN